MDAGLGNNADAGANAVASAIALSGLHLGELRWVLIKSKTNPSTKYKFLAIHVICPGLTGIVPEIACLSRCPRQCLNVQEK